MSNTGDITSLLIFVLAASLFEAIPVIFNVPASVKVGSSEARDRLIFPLEVSAVGKYRCDMTYTASPTAATGDEFEMKQDAKNETWSIRTLEFTDITPGQTYTISVTCTDSSGTSSVGTVTVQTVTSERLTDCTKTVQVDAIPTVAGQYVTTVFCQSVLGHSIYYNLTSNHDYFAISYVDGNITAKTALSALDVSTPSVTLVATCHDQDDQIVYYCDIRIDLLDQNTVPFTNVLPLSETWDEDIASETVLFTLTEEDPDVFQTHWYTFDCVPAAANSLFELTNGNEFRLKTGKRLNHETMGSCYCDFDMHDDYSTGGPFRYTLTIADVNESPVCTTSMYYGTMTENAAVGSEVIVPGFSCADEDDSDTIKYSFTNVNGSSQFSIDPTSGSITVKKTLERDPSDSVHILGVACEDSGGKRNKPLSAICYITITVTDVNDNPPVFTLDNTVVIINEDTPPGVAIVTLAVTDKDTGVNGQYNCSASPATPSTLVTVNSDCSVHLARAASFATDTHISIDVIATDKGTPTLSSTGGLEVIFKKTVTTTVVTTTDYQFWDQAGSVTAFAFAVLSGLLLLGLLLFCCMKYCVMTGFLRQCCYDCCARARRPWYARRPSYPPPPPPMYEPPPPRPTFVAPKKVLAVKTVAPTRLIVPTKPSVVV